MLVSHGKYFLVPTGERTLGCVLSTLMCSFLGYLNRYGQAGSRIDELPNYFSGN